MHAIQRAECNYKNWILIWKHKHHTFLWTSSPGYVHFGTPTDNQLLICHGKFRWSVSLTKQKWINSHCRDVVMDFSPPLQGGSCPKASHLALTYQILSIYCPLGAQCKTRKIPRLPMMYIELENGWKNTERVKPIVAEAHVKPLDLTAHRLIIITSKWIAGFSTWVKLRIANWEYNALEQCKWRYCGNYENQE